MTIFTYVPCIWIIIQSFLFSGTLIIIKMHGIYVTIIESQQARLCKSYNCPIVPQLVKKTLITNE